ncbi:MAG TPA: DUF6458 family protein [Trebonia sp.]
MKTGAGLALIAVGAILAFAINANTSAINLNIVGWVLMIVGVIGLLLPNRTYGWLGRRLTVRRTYPSGPVQQAAPYTPRPGTQALQAGQPTRPTLLDQDLIDEPETRIVNGHPVAGHTEVVEDLYEQP